MTLPNNHCDLDHDDDDDDNKRDQKQAVTIAVEQNVSTEQQAQSVMDECETHLNAILRANKDFTSQGHARTGPFGHLCHPWHALELL